MYIRVSSSILKCTFLKAALLMVILIATGCSSSTQRFSGGSYNNITPTQSTTFMTMTDDPRMLSQNVEIQSSELPPVESSSISDADYNSPYNNSSRQKEVFYPDKNKHFSDGQVMGIPPQNLGTLPRSQVNNGSVFKKNSYIVQSGDTLLSIAQQLGVSVDALRLANGINANSIYIGQSLIIPGQSTKMASNIQNNISDASKNVSSFQSKTVSPVKQGKAPTSVAQTSVKTMPVVKSDTLNIEKNSPTQATTHKSINDTSDQIIDPNDIITPQSTGISKMRWPVRGRLLSHFGEKKGTAVNRGIDIMVPEGSSVKAAENGVVIYASNGLKELGNVVMIRHENNIITIYGHNSKLIVSRGQKVRRGDEIAKSGFSGDAKTPRVYFEVRKNSLPVDPAEYLEN
ncbi:MULTISPECIES: M23 family metallopeptidase [unclassified Bartonella]|uniref:M23 family metallopeptidase n=1 Tax=unclassified Bartonella TaxID=2645622 RepID=UPI00099A69BB|nr:MULTISPECIES: M23 family metallopeptidase [unclassified Bartonella]AQX18092.1 Murein DD-endopeptidase MepM and murein hydrolase activator NlpD, containing LysM domain [Bartonella sp. A1379B]AQX22606.1 Murein DD-endopeptidase MepM and murein hydrolase activator NlpD, containing LysM domain [Bartonella sp. 11B]AQX24111.1 Murein DD-endopeptidase MepM and murein hydrolase activator NlpD, containing LysM domain [Bartonella sp. 114]AQX25055.1 Murein DD-endopeptidase MepM and murein hydrolase activ